MYLFWIKGLRILYRILDPFYLLCLFKHTKCDGDRLKLEVSDWLRNEKLAFEKLYYHSKGISDFDKFRLMYSTPAPFRLRNVFFDLEGIKRV